MGCQKKHPTANSSEGFEFGRLRNSDSTNTQQHSHDARFQRAHLLKFVSDGYAPLKNKWSNLEIGLDTVNCELLAPRQETRAAKFPWAPADLYSNIESGDEKSSAGERKGEKDIYFIGDDNNRNGRYQSADWTIVPDASLTNSMDFLNKKADKKEVSYFFRFQRTGILYETIIRINAVNQEQGCTAIAYVCDKNRVNLADKECTAGGWRQFRKAIVGIHVSGALTDKFKQPKSDRERNDISFIKVELANVDANGIPTGAAYEEVVAQK